MLSGNDTPISEIAIFTDEIPLVNRFIKTSYVHDPISEKDLQVDVVPLLTSD